MHRVREWSAAASVSMCVALAVIAPFFVLGTASGHDVAFHMASWLDAANQWKQGVIFPRWTEWANFGFGEPRFIFYPPLSWLFGAFLGTILPWTTVAAVFIFSVQTFAGLSAYALSRRLVDSRFAALFGAACFAANPYALLIIYMRSDFAELLAIAFFPLLLVATFRLSGLVPEDRLSVARNVVYFAIAFCAIWLSNAPAGVIASYSVAMVFTFAAVRQKSFAPLINGGAGIVLGFGLAAFYLIPAIYEQRWVNITGALAGGLTPADNFLYAKTSDAEHDAFNHIASRMAVLLIVWMIAAAIAARRGAASGSVTNQGSRLFPAMSALGGVATLLMLPITMVFWRYLPELRFVQFPWRWMSILALCAVLFTAKSAYGGLRWAWLIAMAIAITASGHYLVRNAWWDTEDMPTLQAAMKDGSGFEGTDEYDPVGDDHTDLVQKDPRANFLSSSGKAEAHREGKVVVEKWTAEHRALRIITRAPDLVALHLLNYPAWQVTLNKNRIALEHPKGTEQMIVPVPAGESELQIDFTRTWDRSAGGWISIASLAASIWVLAWKRRAQDPVEV
jgi:hypothetical protein